VRQPEPTKRVFSVQGSQSSVKLTWTFLAEEVGTLYSQSNSTPSILYFCINSIICVRNFDRIWAVLINADKFWDSSFLKMNC
jgi:hypothetical protein